MLRHHLSDSHLRSHLHVFNRELFFEALAEVHGKDAIVEYLLSQEET